ncbi:MAG: BBP7 family outer membrane beta-barrel protein [Pirellulaceae bacterium]|nr:BBP7 family outer membrane beta-barrel protein [Pirellulaceae bacterium]
MRIFRPWLALCIAALMAQRAWAGTPCSANVCEALDSCGCTANASLQASECLSDCQCDGCCPAWYVVGEGLFLQRDNGSRRQPVVLAGDSGDTLLDTADSHFDFEGGPRILLGRRTGDCRAWEVSYFGTHFWESTVGIVDPNNLDIPGPLVGVADDFDNANEMVLSYKSQLHNAEFNLVRDLCTWSLLAGFRYVNLDERYNINSTDSDGDVSDYTIRTSNNLFGFQLGGRLERSSGRLGWEAVGKGGIFGNDAIQRQLVRDNDNTFVLRNARDRSTVVSFVGDFNLTGKYALNDCWSVRAGYFVMVVSGVALAPDQLDFNDDLDSGTNLATGGDLFLHGANLGLEARW